MTKYLPILLGAALVACGQDPAPENVVEERVNAAVTAKPASQCRPPMLASVDKAAAEDSAIFRAVKANFATAFASACAKGVLKDAALVDPEAADQTRLFLRNAPESNVASIYLSQDVGNRMVLEYYFVTPDGKTHVPPADEIEEAIYCNVHGATPEEEESSGRCLVD